MLQVLIVDDEDTVREGLRSVIDWGAHGFSICGEGADGEDGLNKLLDMMPDLVMLDIKMPVMGGIEVAERARKTGFTGKIIILSGYSDFKYAQGAIRSGVTAYLLKPIDEDELAGAVQKAREEIEREAEATEREKQNALLARDSVLRDVLLGKPFTEDSLKAHSVEPGSGPYSVALVNSGRPDDVAACVTLADTLRKCFNETQARIIEMDGKVALIFSGGEMSAQLSKAMENINKRLCLRNGEPAFAGLGRTVGTMAEICLSYADAKSIVESRFFYKGIGAVAYEAENNNCQEPAKTVDAMEYAESIYSLIGAGEEEKLCAVLSRIEHDLADVRIQPEKIRRILSGLYIEVQRRLHSAYPGLQFGCQPDSEIMNEIYGKSYLRDVMAFLEESFRRFASCVEGEANRDLSARLLNYIDRNSSSDLKLESLAMLFGYNCTYLGKVIKKTKGESFNTYLGRLRVKKAETLLAGSSLKVYEVGSKVGFCSLNYFYKEFKRQTGLSPQEYRRKYNRQTSFADN
jgi:two-component system response regulator YesN